MDTNETFPIGTHDVRLRRQLVAGGWTDRDITRAVSSGLIHRVRYGAYVDGQLWRRLETDACSRALACVSATAAHAESHRRTADRSADARSSAHIRR